MARIRTLLTKRVIKLLQEMSVKDEEGFNEWYNEFAPFILEGMGMDDEHMRDIAGLARYSCSISNHMISLA